MPDNTPQSILAGLVERIERLNADRASVDTDLADAFREAKVHGFEVKALKALIKRRAADRGQALEQDALVDLYAATLAANPTLGSEA